MTKFMLIDAVHPEETRVAVVENNRVIEFDLESVVKKQNIGNIYLAKITRVESSLQAAFLDYGSPRQGFLPFSEVHEDYYQIPLEDRKLIKEAKARSRGGRYDVDYASDSFAVEDNVILPEIADDNNLISSNEYNDPQQDTNIINNQELNETLTSENLFDEAESEDKDFSSTNINNDEDEGFTPVISHIEEVETYPDIDEDEEEDGVASEELPSNVEQISTKKSRRRKESPISLKDSASYELSTFVEEDNNDIIPSADITETDFETEPLEADEIFMPVESDIEDLSNTITSTPDSIDVQHKFVERKRRVQPRRYHIQEVIRKHQLMLVQVVKEERGNKGAALTTYLSLAGRYCVLMPNTARGGGVSRKISNPKDRQRLKEIIQELDIPQGMGLIIRTAGENKTKNEIKRDFEYLIRLWENVSELTLSSRAPSLVYEEGNIVKRAIRDMYNKDIAKIYVEGDEAYQEAKEFMKVLMPSHVKYVQHYKENLPVFIKYKIEGQLDNLLHPIVQLKSGGYLVISQTEALVAIDINSGRANKKHSVEETALTTNLEAAEEIARQLRLRDLAGLIVIDFIDMEDYRNNRAVEKKFKESLLFDRARIQISRISNFGLMEMTRQRMRPAMQELYSQICEHCHGTGHVRSVESAALRILRSVSEQVMFKNAEEVRISLSYSVINFILNNKRHIIDDIEHKNKIKVLLEADSSMLFPNYKIETKSRTQESPIIESVLVTEQTNTFYIDEEKIIETVESDTPSIATDDPLHRRSKRRRRGRDQEPEENIGITNNQTIKDSNKHNKKPNVQNVQNENRKQQEQYSTKERENNSSRFKRNNQRDFKKRYNNYSDVPQKFMLDDTIEIIIENNVSVLSPVVVIPQTENILQENVIIPNFDIDDIVNETLDAQNMIDIINNAIQEESTHSAIDIENTSHVVLDHSTHYIEETLQNNSQETISDAGMIANTQEHLSTPEVQETHKGWWKRRFGLLSNRDE